MAREKTHRVVGGPHFRYSSTRGTLRQYEPGDLIAPTERELRDFPDRFEPIAKVTEDNDEATEEEEGNSSEFDEATDEGK